MRALYAGKLEARRTQERREQAKSAGAVYGLAIAGRAAEIDAGDARRLHDSGQLDGLLEAAQYARGANPKGDLLFKERYLAMSPRERAGYGLGELAKRLSAADFLEVMQGAAGEEDPARRERMRDFVPLVQPALRSVALGPYATPQERARDEQELGLIRSEVDALVDEQEKKNGGRRLTTTEYRRVVREVSDRALIRTTRLDLERRAQSFADAMAMNPEEM